jgi:hypothetical protein
MSSFNWERQGVLRDTELVELGIVIYGIESDEVRDKIKAYVESLSKNDSYFCHIEVLEKTVGV